MIVLVTGSTGLLGKHVVAALVERGHSVRALVRPYKKHRPAVFPPHVQLAYADLRRRDGLEAMLDGVDVVVHLAACVVGDDEAQFASTVVGTENLLDAMSGCGVRRLIHCSSYSVYDWRAARGTLDESTPLEANLYDRDGYAIAKTWQERLVARFRDEGRAEVLILRPGFIWGHGRHECAGVGQSLGRFDLVLGIRRRLPLTYVENCAECFASAVEHTPDPEQVLNVVDDELPTAWRYARMQSRAAGRKSYRVLTPYWLALGVACAATRVSKWLYSGRGKLPGVLVPIKFRARFRPLKFPNRLVKQTLGWSPRYGLDEAWERSLGELGPVVQAGGERPAASSKSGDREAVVV